MSVLLVCSGGGHLKQLSQLLPRMPFADQERVWVTFDTGLSRSLLRGQDVRFSYYAAPRDAVGMGRNLAFACEFLATRRFDHVVSTGANLAVNFLPLARLRGSRCYYIESAARAAGPSLTGKIMHRTPGIATYTQYRHWADRGWCYAGSVFDAYRPGPVRSPGPLKKAVVTVGTNESYPFRRLFDRLAGLLDGMDVLWQTGTTDVHDLPINARPTVPHDEMLQAIDEADVIITHSGTGSALSALERGRTPILVPRLRRYGEHIDDHQVQIAAELASRELAVHRAVEDLDADALTLAATRSTARVDNPPPLSLW